MGAADSRDGLLNLSIHFPVREWCRPGFGWLLSIPPLSGCVEFYAPTIEFLQGTTVVGISLCRRLLPPTGHRNVGAGQAAGGASRATTRPAGFFADPISYSPTGAPIFDSTDSRQTQAKKLAEIWDSGASTQNPNDRYDSNR